MELKRFLGNIARVFLATGALSISAIAVADDTTMSGCATAPACDTGCCGEPCCEPPVCGWAYNPPGYCRCNDKTDCGDCWTDGLTARVDFLWWRADVEQSMLGVQNESYKYVNNGATGTNARSTVVNSEHHKMLDFKYSPGFRLALYNACASGCWDIGLGWTHFNTSNSTKGTSFTPDAGDTRSDPSFEMNSFWSRTFGTKRPDVVTGKYSMTMDNIDLEFGRKFYVSSCFVLRPHFGLRGSKIDQSYNIDALLDAELPTAHGQAYIESTHMRNNLIAVGPRVGLEAEIKLGCGFSIFGEAAGSLVFGRFARHTKATFQDLAAFDVATTTDYTYETKGSKERGSRLFTDLSIGFKWERCFDWCNRLHPVAVAFAWEHHCFSNMNNFDMVSHGYSVENHAFHPYVIGSPVGNITTQGLTVCATFGF